MDDPNLRFWRACAGLTVRIPPSGSEVYYFPQGHAEHASSRPTFPPSDVPAFLCCLDSARFRADRDTDEVFAEFRLTFAPPVGVMRGEESVEGDGGSAYAKVLTQSDANNGGGFSVPRQCAVSIFPPLDLREEMPAQNINVRDVHGATWQFRHIYRGTPRRHLLTTGWSKFVNNKKFVAGDTIIFVRTNSGEIFVGIRRSINTGSNDSGSGEVPFWMTPFNRHLQRPNAVTEITPAAPRNQGFCRRRGRFPAASVVETVARAISRQAFDVVYYPGAGMPEFCVGARAVAEAMEVQWRAGMKFRMEVDTEDLSKTIWCSGTVLAVSVADRVCWPNSPWKMLEVSWDEPETLPNVKRVSPWEIELVISVPHISLPTFSFQRKKPRTLDNSVPKELPAAVDGVMANVIPLAVNYDNFPAGIQGARHDSMFTSGCSAFLPIETHHIPFLDPELLQSTFPGWNYGSAELTTQKSSAKSCNEVHCHGMEPIANRAGNPPKSLKNVGVQLFGAIIKSEMNADCFNNEANNENRCSLNLISRKQVSEHSLEGRNQVIFEGELNEKCRKEGILDPLGGDNHDQPFMTYKDSMVCKVYKEVESGAPGRAIDLAKVCSYEQLYQKLSRMFLMEESLLQKRLFYKGSAGSLRQVGEEPFREFATKVRKLTII